MSELITLLLQYLPLSVEAIKYLKYVPDAVDTVKELISYVNRIVAILKQPGMLSPAQEAVLDAIIENHKNEEWWQPDPEITPPIHVPPLPK